MGKETFFDKVRSFIGHIAWVTFLWSIRMSQDEYLDSISLDNAENIVEKINKRLNITPSVELYNELVGLVRNKNGY